MSVTNNLKEIAKKEIEDMNYEFVDLKYGRRGKNWYLQVFADKEGGITVDDCAKISEQLGYELDRHPELLRHSYNLEVSSPGLDRPLRGTKDFKKFKNNDIVIKLYSPIEEKRTWHGKIIDAHDKKLYFKDKEGKKREVDLDNISIARLEVKI
ncbi:MAG: ribosome maturation factor RimP [Elusimicrobiota bacterium]